MAKNKTITRWLLRTILAVFVAMNIIAALHAWRFTHFTAGNEAHPEHAAQWTWTDKLKMALTGVPNPRPENRQLPSRPYTTIDLQGREHLACWYMATDQEAKGTVILFHGYGGEKSAMLDRAYCLLDEGYNVLLPDFGGCGSSGGSTCTIGYREAGDVQVCCNYIRLRGEQHLILLGTSMGAAAVLKYLHDGGTQPSGVILECPFGTMYQTVCRRFQMMHAPTFPMAGLLVCWGGIENGFWAFSHNPGTYAQSVHCPALLIWGAQDDRVTRGETERIYENLAGRKMLRIYPAAGHANYLNPLTRSAWTADVDTFLSGL